MPDADQHHKPHESQLERWLNRRVARATTPRGAAVVIATASIVVTIAAGVLMTVTDHERYPDDAAPAGGPCDDRACDRTTCEYARAET